MAEVGVEWDVLIVGSGPIGCTFARVLHQGGLRVLMLEVGSQLSAKYGENAKNVYLYNYHEDGLDTLSNVVKGELIPVSQPVNRAWPETLDPICQPKPVARKLYAGTRKGFNGQNPEQDPALNLPSAASSFQVGGMAGHWTCCTPRPFADERIGPDLIPEAELDQLYAEAEEILNTNQTAFAGSLRGQVVQAALADAFPTLPTGREVAMLPLACQRQRDHWVHWTGADTILGGLAVPGSSETFQLRAETLCRRLIWEDRLVTGAVVTDLKTQNTYEVRARYVVVAANSVCTPQLLWASDIRPEPLGRYLNDQPMLFCQVVLSHAILAQIRKLPGARNKPIPIPRDDPIPNVWIPYSPQHPYHCQVHRDSFPYSQLPGNTGIDHRTIIELRWFCCKEIRAEDRMFLSNKFVDQYGMPQITFDYSYSRKDEETIHAAFADITKVRLVGHKKGGPCPWRFLAWPRTCASSPRFFIAPSRHTQVTNSLKLENGRRV